MCAKSSTCESAYLASARAILARAEAERDVSHAGLRGAAVEELLAEFLGKHLPRRFEVLRDGLVLGADDSYSCETDLIIHDSEMGSPVPLVTPVITPEAVVGTVEVKTTLRSADIGKTISAVARVKNLPQRASHLGKIDPHDGVVAPLSAISSWLKQSTLLSLWSKSPLSTIAKSWHRHYLDVPFGYQIDSIVCLSRGVVNLACAHPENRYAPNCLSPVPCVTPGIDDPDGPSILLWPLITRRHWRRDVNIAIGPRVPWSKGSAVFMAVTECGESALGMWFRLLLDFLASQVHLRENRSIARPKLDATFPFREFSAIPLAIAADADRVTAGDRDYVLAAVRVLLDFQEADRSCL